MAGNRKRNGLLVLAGAGIATVAIIKITSLADTVKSLQLKVLSIKINFPKIFATIQIFNPTKNQITIDSIVGEVFFNNKSIGNIQYINKVPIQPQTYSTFNNVLIEVSPAGEITLLTDIIQQKSHSGTFLLNGKIYVKGNGFPFSQSVKVF